MTTTRSLAGLGYRPDITMAAFGLISGLATVGWFTLTRSRRAWGAADEWRAWTTQNIDPQRYEVYAEWLEPVAALFLWLPADLLPIGLFFGTAIALGVWLRTANPWAVPVLLVATTYAWSAANLVTRATILSRTPELAASLAGGALGAGITHLGCALFSRPLRRPACISLTVAVGAMAGLLLFASERGYAGEWLLYVVWQPAVAFAIGRGLAQE